MNISTQKVETKIKKRNQVQPEKLMLDFKTTIQKGITGIPL